MKKLKNSKTLFCLFVVLIIGSLISIATWGAIRACRYLSFYKGCESFLKNSVYTDSITLTKTELSYAISYLEEKDLTHGRVSIITQDINNDIGYFYENLKEQYMLLVEAENKNLNDREQEDVLKIYRKNICNNFGSPKIPNGITIYPYNIAFFWWSIISIILFIISFASFRHLVVNLQYFKDFWQKN